MLTGNFFGTKRTTICIYQNGKQKQFLINAHLCKYCFCDPITMTKHINKLNQYKRNACSLSHSLTCPKNETKHKTRYTIKAVNKGKWKTSVYIWTIRSIWEGSDQSSTDTIHKEIRNKQMCILWLRSIFYYYLNKQTNKTLLVQINRKKHTHTKHFPEGLRKSRIIHSGPDNCANSRK